MPKEKISCIMWDGNEWKGVDLSMIEISNYIDNIVKKAAYALDYFYIGIVLSIILGRKKNILIKNILINFM